MPSPRLRFAPSPNGRLHLGHACSALLNAEIARALQGELLLRIEDIDPVRCRPELTEGLVADLAWLGLTFPEPVWRQSARMSTYRAALDSLRARGLVYPCTCTRREILAAAGAARDPNGAGAARDPDGAPLYPGTCRGRPVPDAPYAWRLDMARALEACRGPFSYTAFVPGEPDAVRAADPARWGDAVLGRKDIPTSYHLAVVLDDAAQGITHVVRGQDLEAATDLHVLLQRLLGLPTPRYHHHGLIRDEAGEKLSKSLRSEALAALRERGVSAAEVRARLGFGDARQDRARDPLSHTGEGRRASSFPGQPCRPR
ncbi:tRNA glutamyl-Q(34) synthetase GluQRS [Methylobacterium nonmethylotrophicum]|uniref:tRNA glutamyl-Q(34) synthetase GluQRS n=1 Tax=Methylobacterium nonmethylotrophicum TaxID=1141884 RepID=A0A4Z0NT50_9HYPH|nr:tRNA glutamyl-Q(34) synthetase GluQRS [Methylobacterium nonmethylotrophicum]TGE00210.1 tRNA glutamyl-Q(34) synthetase GluQRS [Methylobacterium nonmethylotrophicum]